MARPKQIGCAGIGILALTCFFLVMGIEQCTKTDKQVQAPSPNKTIKENNAPSSDFDKEVAKNVAIGEVILTASCMGKQGAIPRDQMGNYIAAAVKEQGISKSQLFKKWDFYWGFAKRAEERNGTSCLD